MIRFSGLMRERLGCSLRYADTTCSGLNKVQCVTILKYRMSAASLSQPKNETAPKYDHLILEFAVKRASGNAFPTDSRQVGEKTTRTLAKLRSLTCQSWFDKRKEQQ